MKEETKRLMKQVENHVLMMEITRLFKEQDKKNITFTVRGYSMRPFLEDGRDKVILAPPRQPQIGDVALAAIGDKVYALHRVIKIEDGVYTMQGDGNPTYMTETFRDADIIGIADGFIRKGKIVRTDSALWRSYSFVWKILKPFRRIILAVYRRMR